MRRSRPFFRWLTGWLLLSLLGVGALGGAGLSVRAAPQLQTFLSVIINEVAWGGTAAGTSDEWIELYNPTGSAIDITGWRLFSTSDNSPNIILSGSIPAGGYFLLERTDNNTVSDIPADQIYTGDLGNSGETLQLLALDGITVVDTVNQNRGAWSGGSGSPNYASMERISHILDTDGNWGQNDGVTVNGLDANSNPLRGTPKQQNSIFAPAPQPPPIEILINEVAWGGTVASSDDDWIELHNPDLANPVDISDWELISNTFSITIPNPTVIPPDGYYLIERRQLATDVPSDLVFSSLLLGNNGDTLRLRKPDGTLVDTANANGGGWPAGIGPPDPATMERGAVVADSDFAWVTYPDTTGPARDAGSNPVLGTPGGPNLSQNVTATATKGPTNTPTRTPTSTGTTTPTRTNTPLPGDALSVVINEVAWAGTQASPDDEWIELYNTTNANIDLSDWNLLSSDGSPAISVEFDGIILGPGEFLLMERTDDDATNVPADITYPGSLSNAGEILRLYDAGGFLIDSANANGGPWPAGISSTFSSMQRSVIATDGTFVWVTYDVTKDTGTKAKDANGNDIKGTPGRANRPINVTPTGTPISTTSGGGRINTAVPPLQPILGISEFLPRPGFDWNNDGLVDVFDEFVEIINAGRIDVNLSAYQLDDEDDLGSVPYSLPNITLKPDERAVFYASETGILLSDAGETVRLVKGSTVVDAYTYPVARYPDQSWCRLPDRLGYWYDPCFPTPNNPNSLTGTIPQPVRPSAGYVPPVCLLPDTTPVEFVYAECEAGGDGIWSRQFWDGADASDLLKFIKEEKWETIFE